MKKSLLAMILAVILILTLFVPCFSTAEEIGELDLYDPAIYEDELDLEDLLGETDEEIPDAAIAAEPFSEDEFLSADENSESCDYAISATSQSGTPEKYVNRPRIEVSGYLGWNLIDAAVALGMNEYSDDGYYETDDGTKEYGYSSSMFTNGQYSSWIGDHGGHIRSASVSSCERYNWTVNSISDFYEFEYEEDIDFSAYPSLSFYGVYCGQSISEARDLLLGNNWMALDTWGDGEGTYVNSNGEYLYFYSSWWDGIIDSIDLFSVQGWNLYNDGHSFMEKESGKPVPTAISLDKTGTIYVAPGSLTALTPVVAPENAARILTWKSSKPKVASVTQWGLLEAKQEGTTKITVTTKNKKKTSLTVKVVDPNKPDSISISNGKSVTLNLGEPMQLNAVLAPSTAKTSLSWKSSKPKVATVDNSGIVTPLKEGTTTITVKTANNKKTTITVKVVDPYKPTGVTIVQGKSANINLGDVFQLNAFLTPETARSELIWKSGKTSIATVDGNGIVTALKEGTAKITVTTRNKKKATITIKVVDPYKPTGVTIAQGKSLTMKLGETLQLNASLAPSTAQSGLTWKSSKGKIASVDANGVVTAKKKGTAKITVTTRNKKKATITIKVVG